MIAQKSAELVLCEMWVNNPIRREVKSFLKGNLKPSTCHQMLFCPGKKGMLIACFLVSCWTCHHFYPQWLNLCLLQCWVHLVFVSSQGCFRHILQQQLQTFMSWSVMHGDHDFKLVLILLCSAEIFCHQYKIWAWRRTIWSVWSRQ